MSLDFGLKIGKVTRPEPNDAEAKKRGPNCVQVSLPCGVDSSGKAAEKKVYARVLASFAGGDEKNPYGSVIIPQNNDQVLVGYLDGHDEGEAYILGSVYQGNIKPPYDISKDVAGGDTKAGESMVIKLKNKTQISINNVDAEATSIMITTGKNNRVISLVDNKNASLLQITDNAAKPQTYLKMDFQNGNVELKAKTKMIFAAGAGDQGSIVIDGNSGNITIGNKKGNIDIQSTANANIKGAQVTVEGQTKAEVKSSNVTINGSMGTEVKGATVKLG